jgi:IclR family transcriptional regulator, acetate operon repressor
VDNALRLLLLLAERDRVRVSDIAAELDIAPSTAHRLLSTFRARGFVEQNADRSYGAGHAFALLSGRSHLARSLEDVSQPHLERLRDHVQETCNLAVLDGAEMRFLASVESDQVLRVGTRVGGRVPAYRTSGGKAILAALSGVELVRRFPPHGLESLVLPGDDVDRLRAELERVGRRGYGVNRGEAERGVAAVGVGLLGPAGEQLVALSISLPTVRFRSEALPEMVDALRRTKNAIEAELAA